MKVMISIFVLSCLLIAFVNCDNKCGQSVPDNLRIDCNPVKSSKNETCLERGCCWKQASTDGAPSCYFPTDYVGYKVVSIKQQSEKVTRAHLTRQTPSGWTDDVKTVYLDIIQIDAHRLRIKMFDSMVQRYEVPFPKLDLNSLSSSDNTMQVEPVYKVSITMEGLLQVSRKSTGTVVFSTNLSYLTFADQYLQMTTKLPSNDIYGLGEHRDGFVKKITKWKSYTFFAFGNVPDDSDNYHLYSVHPFFLNVEDTQGNSNGMLLFNSNAMDIVVSPAPTLTWRTIGGIFDLYIFMGPTHNEVIRQYQHLIGLPSMPPYWSLGYHLCRYGYFTLNNTKKTFRRNIDAGVPIEVQWIDIDAMDNGNDFTYDKVKFDGLPEYINELHKEGRKYVTMLDAGVASGEKPGSYPPYDDGVKHDIFIKNASGKYLRAKVWNKYGTAFPDFTHPKAHQYWSEQVEKFHSVLPFDGIWNDMNEPTNFGDGSVDGCPQSKYEDPAYLPGQFYKLNHLTICMTAKQHAGLHYDVHSLFGLTQTMASNAALTNLKKRPFIISRSTFVGQGHFGGHWDGDLVAKWDSMKWTISSILNFNMFGVPMMGADICGFNGNTTVPLCARWSALGAFYPFARNHNEIGQRDQDPAALGPIVVKAAKDSLNLRYQLLPLLYTLFYKAHINGDTVFRPLFFEFPQDVKAKSIDTQFMWGDSLLVIPTLEENATSVNAYIPSGVWFRYPTFTRYNFSESTEMKFDSPLTAPPVLLIRGGKIIATHESRLTTTEARKTNFTLIVALDNNGQADGDLYWDDGESLSNIQANIFAFTAKQGTLNILKKKFDYNSPLTVDRVYVLGVKKFPTKVKVNNESVAFTYYSLNQRIEITHIGKYLERMTNVTWS